MLTKMYQYKFYLDANHYVVFDDKVGEIHPHTWEIALGIQLVGKDVIPFYIIEEEIKDELAIYQNKLLNEIKPFDTLNPTLENIGDYFTNSFTKRIANQGWNLRTFMISETPSRSYITLY